ncbi:kinesin-like protein KIF28 [Tubulanus polymorphus]|uniref:kinesin-like protein KIF28 n=1 Tax=Tubulanus polymorphus TaxID=672921 RepID=UPI003DA4A4AB
MSDCVRVAVRVRPFNQREKNANSKCILSMHGNSTDIIHPKTKQSRTFAFDYSYWSHDGCRVDDAGISVPESSSSLYADQMKVFNDLGQGVLDNAWKGYNAALFAYGQTGSGKSYSMIGYGANKGIVPIACEKLFQKIEENRDNTKQLQVSFSMLEIYNEQVKDLLVKSKPERGGLKIRQNPKTGFYVEGLKQFPVRSYKNIEELMDQGTINRTTASTNMNATSSRSHMVITIRFKQVFLNEHGESTTKTSEINLVDLAGSERADSTGATGDRLKEGSAINLSLTTLGNVISALVEESKGKKKGLVVPYRDSVLTKLLQSALGGNSKTIMIAALSPADINYDETMSTLKFADRAKAIQNKAVINESPTDRLIRELREENARLMSQLSTQGGTGRDVRQEELEYLIEENKRQMDDQVKSWEERLEEARREWEKSVDKTSKERKVSTTEDMCPYLQNVNEDPQLSGVIRYCLKGKKVVGRPGVKTVDIEMRGLGIQARHAVFSVSDKTITVEPASAQAVVVINGKQVSKLSQIKHKDRIKLGSNCLYLVIGFPEERKIEDGDYGDFDYDFFQTELAEKSSIPTNVKDSDSAASLQDLGNTAIFHDFIAILPKVYEANAMSDDMKKGIRFEPTVKNMASHDSLGRSKAKEILVKVTNTSTNQVWMWPKGKFINRKYLIEDMYLKWQDGEDVECSRKDDPFWDPIDDIFLGSCHIWLQCLSYCIELDDFFEVQNYRGEEEASLKVAVKPCDEHGKPVGDEAMVLNPDELIGKRVDLIVSVRDCMGLKWIREDNSRGVYCRFYFYDSKKMFRTKITKGQTNFSFDFKKQFTIHSVTDEIMNYIQTNALVVELMGTQVSYDNAETAALTEEDDATDSCFSSEGDGAEMVGYSGDQLALKLKLKIDEVERLNKKCEILKSENMKLKDEMGKLKETAHHMTNVGRRRTPSNASSMTIQEYIYTEDHRDKGGIILPKIDNYPHNIRHNQGRTSLTDHMNAFSPSVYFTNRSPDRQFSISPPHVFSPDVNIPVTDRRPSLEIKSMPLVSPERRFSRRLSKDITLVKEANEQIHKPPAQKSTIDPVLVKALKVFFKEIKDIENIIIISEQTCTSRNEPNVTLGKLHDDISRLRKELSSSVGSLKSALMETIKKIQHQTSSSNK